jgi:hypothetical protein
VGATVEPIVNVRYGWEARRTLASGTRAVENMGREALACDGSTSCCCAAVWGDDRYVRSRAARLGHGAIRREPEQDGRADSVGLTEQRTM